MPSEKSAKLPSRGELPRPHISATRAVVVTPPFSVASCMMVVGTGMDVADACARAAPGIPLVHVRHVAAAVTRMLVRRPLVVVVEESVGASEVEQVIEGASDVGAEVVVVGEVHTELVSAVQSALRAAEQRRNPRGIAATTVHPSATPSMPHESGKLLDTVSRALDWQENQADANSRHVVLATIRRAVDDWMRGELTTDEAVAIVASAVPREAS